MSRWRRMLYVIAGLAAAFILVASVTAAARDDSWGPLESVAWLPAVIVAVWSADRAGQSGRRCLGQGRPPR